MVLATLKLQLKHCKPLTNANKTRYNVDLSSDKETAVSLGSTSPIGTWCCSSFVMMETFSLRKNGIRQSRCGLRHARGQLIERQSPTYGLDDG